jgi:hypothetical protein
MNISINFPAEIETRLLRRATLAGKDVATLVQEFVVESLADEAVPVAKPNSHAEFMARLNQAIDIHPASTGFVDDSRDSIYAGRGE